VAVDDRVSATPSGHDARTRFCYVCR
jgi:hypothetical protein